MSNALAIAATTATLRSLLYRGFPEGQIKITTKPLDAAGKGVEGDQVNLFLYHTTIDAAWRNQDMSRRVRSGETGFPPLPLNLYYLVTAYHNGDDETSAQMLLGRAMGILHDHAVLGAGEIRDATANDVAESDLHEQIERIRITPQPLSVDEISKLWAAFQTNYRLSVAYQVSVVLIESAQAALTPLPVLMIGEEGRGPVVHANMLPPFPTIEDVELPNGHVHILQGDQVTLLGHHFALDAGDPAQVESAVHFTTTRLDEPLNVSIPVDQRSAGRISFRVPYAEGAFFPAGLYRVAADITPANEPLKTRSTNEIPLQLAPRILQINGENLPIPGDGPIQVARNDIVDGLGDATLVIRCSPDVLPEQPALLLIGNRLIPAEEHNAQTDALTFNLTDFTAGTYRLRLRVDGVESPLIDRSDPKKPRFDDAQRVELT